ncbi:MAG: polyribonucleotide nucleotidyltransferase [Candidatus Colwellbacteria bacterium]|nr:polyribonucleotide nucleotidyltransferase [Candidatus Colwellbacteria bacterium]
MDLNRKVYKTTIAGEEVKLEVSNLAGQANAAVLGTYGQTAVLVTAVMDKHDRDGIDFMPLSVDFEEKFYAAGKILGSRFVRREGKPSDAAILSGRLIDRTIRPLFDDRIRRSIQIVVTVLSYDGENDPDFIALLSTSAALTLSDIPWNGPVAGVRVAKTRTGEPVINPKNSYITENSDKLEFDSFVSGPKKRINMIELAGDNAEDVNVLKAYEAALKECEKLIEFQQKFAKDGKTKAELGKQEFDAALIAEVDKFLKDKLDKAFFNKEKAAIYRLKDDLIAYIKELKLDVTQAGHIYESKLNDVLHSGVLDNNKRPDGRALDEVRDLHSEVGLLPRTHGSALFIRGNTQALAVTTIGPPGAEQIIETMEEQRKRKFLLHYNFPKYSVGETGSFRGPGRRDIGHGALAEKAILPVLPDKDAFPYTIRVVSEILSSNGSSSMATTCATSLSLMDAGVPIKNAVAGIAIGLVVDEKTLSTDKPRYKILTDIQGPEDHYGDMDFKVAGTKDGINAVQMDVKFGGLTLQIIKDALASAEAARTKILGVMNKCISKPRAELSPYAPRVLRLKIDPARIGEVIGSGGKIINGIIESTGATAIDIEDDGTVFVSGDSVEAAERAVAEIESILKELEVGEIITGKVIKILEFGAIVDLGGGKDGMIHVSELKDGFVKSVHDVVKVGDEVTAKVVRVENGKVGLSLKQAKR